MRYLHPIWMAWIGLMPVSELQARTVAVHDSRVSRPALQRVSRAILARSGTVAGRRTLEATSMRQLIAWSAPVSSGAFRKYAGQFEAYWHTANLSGQREGKALEAVFAWRGNASRRGIGTRLAQMIPGRFAHGGRRKPIYLVTAVEGFPSHSADLVELTADGTELARYQSKLSLSLRSASRYLVDPRYEGMRLLTTHESYQRVTNQLTMREAAAVRRGVPLMGEFQRVRDAMASGRFPGNFAGRRLPSRVGLERLAKSASRAQFERGVEAAGSWRPAPAVFKHGGVVVIVFNFGLEYRDIRRYVRGKISADYLGVRTTIRAAEIYLAYYAVTSPEPISKVGSAAAAVFLLAADVGTDFVQGRRATNARLLFQKVDREEQYFAAKSQIANTMQGAVGVNHAL